MREIINILLLMILPFGLLAYLIFKLFKLYRHELIWNKAQKKPESGSAQIREQAAQEERESSAQIEDRDIETAALQSELEDVQNPSVVV